MIPQVAELTNLRGTSSFFRILSIAVSLVSVSSLIAGTAAPKPTSIDRPRTNHGFVSVSYPSHFDPSKAYSVLYWFHGTSGEPSPGIGTAAEDFVAVGMSYLKAPHVPAGEYGKSHWEECLAVRSELEAAGLQLDRDVVGGVSKGGWVSFQIAVEVPDGPDGVVITAAGKPPGFNLVNPLPKSLSVLIGVGETDPNYPHSQKAVAYFRECGASLCYEEWLGKGHVSQPSELVVDWLKVESLRGRSAELSAYANARVQRELIMIEGLSDPRERYAALRALMGHPALPHADPSQLSQTREKGRAQSGDPEIAGWLKEFNSLRDLVARESSFYDGKDFDPAELEVLVGHYRKYVEDTVDPALAARAAFAAVRTEKLVEIEKLKLKAREIPEYVELDRQLKAKLEEFQKATGDSKNRLFAELNPLLTRVNTMRNSAAMDAFDKVEWRRLQVNDHVISAGLAADPQDRIRVRLGAGF